jgi:hypothetical protein
VLVHAQGHFGCQRLLVKTPGFGKSTSDEVLRDVMMNDDEETDGLEGAPQLHGSCFQGSWHAGQVRTEIDYGDHRVGASVLWRKGYSHRSSPCQVSRPLNIVHKGMCARKHTVFCPVCQYNNPDFR